MAHPARAIDPFTLKQIRIRQDNMFMLVSHLGIECDKLKQLVRPFMVDDDDYDELGIQLLWEWLDRVKEALPESRWPDTTGW